MSWKRPTDDVLFTDSHIRELLERDHDKPTAMGTVFRYSDALNCSRRLAFVAYGVEQSDPIDAAGVGVTAPGTAGHELVQEAMARRYPGRCEFEVPSQVGLISGSADALVTLDRRIVYELKFTGGYAFDKAIGVNRKSYKSQSPEGPRPSAIAQAGLNAIGLGADEVRVGYVAREAISKQLGDKLNLSQFDRICAEWVIPEEVWRPLAESEIARVEAIAEIVRAEEVPDGDAWDEKAEGWISINPNDARPHWSCLYCPWSTACVAFEAGIDITGATSAA